MPTAPCPNAELCGGCMYQGVPYERQLEEKNATVLGFLAENNIRCGEYAGVFPSPDLTAYRNKMEYSFGDAEKGGEMNLGLHRKRSYMSVIDVSGCMIVPEDFETIRKAVLAFAKERGYSFRHKKTRSGFLRNLIVRRGMRTGEVLVNLVTTSEDELDTAGFVSCIEAAPLASHVRGILHTIYDGRADTAGCDELRVLRGDSYYREKLLGLDFNVGANTFFQTNVSAAERMFDEAFGLLGNLEGKHVYDVYCGTGALSLMLASRAGASEAGASEGDASGSGASGAGADNSCQGESVDGETCRVTGIEIVRDSVEAAKANAVINGITNVEFVCGDALEAMDALADRPDAIVVDPPRMGMHPKALKKIISYGLPEILYISCNPKTFCADMAVLQGSGYRLDVLRSYDNFPFTRHIELAARIIRS